MCILGALKKNNDKLRHHVKELKTDQEQIIWGPDINGTGEKIPALNGYKSRLFVNFFEPDDGKGQIVKTSQILAEEAKNGKLEVDDITIEFVDNKLNKGIWELPDPELALYFGGVCSNFGFLPWQTRLTEFLGIKTQSSVTSIDFVRSLYCFSKCEQRFGK